MERWHVSRLANCVVEQDCAYWEVRVCLGEFRLDWSSHIKSYQVIGYYLWMVVNGWIVTMTKRHVTNKSWNVPKAMDSMPLHSTRSWRDWRGWIAGHKLLLNRGFNPKYLVLLKNSQAASPTSPKNLNPNEPPNPQVLAVKLRQAPILRISWPFREHFYPNEHLKNIEHISTHGKQNLQFSHPTIKKNVVNNHEKTSSFSPFFLGEPLQRLEPGSSSRAFCGVALELNGQRAPRAKGLAFPMGYKYG